MEAASTECLVGPVVVCEDLGEVQDQGQQTLTHSLGTWVEKDSEVLSSWTQQERLPCLLKVWWFMCLLCLLVKQ